MWRGNLEPFPANCEECKKRHPATKISLKEQKEYNCRDKCPIPRLLPQNVEALDLMSRFGPVINGQSISASGIQQAMEWYGVHPDNYAITANKVIIYYSIFNSKIQEEQIRKQKHASEANTNRSKGRRPKRH